MCMSTHTCQGCVRRSEDNWWSLGSSFYHGPRLGGKHLDLLSHLIQPFTNFSAFIHLFIYLFVCIGMKMCSPLDHIRVIINPCNLMSMCLKQEVASIIFDQNQCNSASANPQADVIPPTFCLCNYSPQDCLDLLTRVQRSSGNRTSSSSGAKG